MPVYWSGLLLAFVVFWCYITCALTVERKTKSVVFSYASASHPHVATLSHHYRAHPLEPHLQQYLPPSSQHSQQYVPPSAVQNDHFPRSASQSHQPAAHPENFQQQDGHLKGDGIIHYDDRNSDIYQSPTPIYDYTTLRPYEYESSTVVYHNHQPVENHNYYQPNFATELPPDNDLYRFNDHSTVSPDLRYPLTPVYYNDRPPDNIPNIQPSSHDRPQGYDRSSSTGFSHLTHDRDDLTNNYHHSQTLQDNNEQFREYTTTKPFYFNNNNNINSPIDHETPKSFPIAESPQSGSNLTQPRHSNQYLNSNGSPNQNFPDYQAPASPEYFDSSSSTQVYYYEDENDFISTTPIINFESVKEELPPIKDYPPPKPSYITKPFTNSSNQKKNIERGQQTKRPSKALDKSSMVHHTNNKVLQKPKYFAYSSDFLDDHDDLDVEIEQVGHQNIENDEEHDHEQKKKDEKYAKGGGQERHSVHKATAGDKGDKGYKSGHKHEEGNKGRHEKEDHKGKYVDEKGKKGKEEEEGGHFGEQHKAEKGKKAAKYGESGEHKKGHSTKGEHNIHKMDEYMKKHEFYDEHHEGGDHEKFGGFMEAHVHKKGGKKKKGHHEGGHHKKHKGKKRNHEKGHTFGHHKGHKDAKGYDGRFSKHKKYGKKGGSKRGKKWGYSRGHPPK